MLTRSSLVCILVLCATATPTPAATLRVPSEYPTIQDAIDAAVAGDDVLVAPGVYNQTTDRDIPGIGIVTSAVFLKSDVDLLSESGPTGTYIDQSGPLGCRVYAVAGFGLNGGNLRIEGFTIRAFSGSCVTVEIFVSPESVVMSLARLMFENQTSDHRGLAVQSTNAIVTDCTFSGWRHPGAITLENTQTTPRTFTIRRCVVEDCEGSAIRLVTSSNSPAVVDIRESSFRQLPAAVEGAIWLSGAVGGIVQGCEFEQIVGGAGSYSAGGISAYLGPAGSDLQILDNTFFATTAPVIDSAGALYCRAGVHAVEIAGNTFVAGGASGGTAECAAIVSTSATSVLRNNVVAYHPGALPAVVVQGNVLSDCNVFWNNAGGDGSGFMFGAGDRVVDPLICDPAGGDLSLRSGSPCLPANSVGCGLIGALGQGCGPVSIESLSWGRIKASFR